MAGKVRVATKRTDLWGGRLALTKRKTGDLAYREAGSNALSSREGRLYDLILHASKQIPNDAAEQLIATGDIAQYNLVVLNILSKYQDQFAEVLRQQLIESAITATRDLTRELSAGWASMGKAETPPLPSQAVLNYTFDATSLTATEFARAQSASLVTNMVQSQREAIRDVVSRAYTIGRTPQQLSSDLFGALREVSPSAPANEFAKLFGTNMNGLTVRYEQAVIRRAETLATQLAEKGITGSKALEKIQKDSAKYSDKLRRARARTIARTEMMRANNEGKLQSFLQAEKDGLISSKDARKQWSTSRFDVCNICVPLAGKLVPLRQPFFNNVQTPPAHPNCRCTMNLVTNIKTHTPPQLRGSNRPSDPFSLRPSGLTDEGQALADTPIVIDLTPSVPMPSTITGDKALAQYVTDSYRTNTALRQGLEPTDLVRAIDDVMAESTLPEMQVYRAMEFDSGDPVFARIDGLKRGDTFDDLAFQSTSTDIDVVEDFMPMGYEDQVIMRIKVPEGTHGIQLGDRFGVQTGMGDQGEVLLDRNVRYRVLRTSRDADGRRIVDLEVVSTNQTRALQPSVVDSPPTATTTTPRPTTARPVQQPTEPINFYDPDARASFVQEAYSYTDPETGWTVRLGEARATGGYKYTKISGTIVDADGNEIGQITRSVDLNGTVFHDLFDLKPEYQGQGFASRLNAHAENVYRRRGVRQIELEAGMDVGGYAWARQGYNLRLDEVKFTVDEARSYFRLHFERRAKEGHIPASEIDRLLGFIERNDMAGLAADTHGKGALLGSKWSAIRSLV